MTAVMMPTPLVNVDWLRAHLDHPQVIVVDCRFALSDPTAGQQAYATSHIPGAFYLGLDQDLSGPVQANTGRHPLPPLEQLIATWEAIGIGSHPATAVVAYDATKGAFAARLWWLLRYLGHAQVAVLDGGWQAWQAAAYPVTAAIPEPPPKAQFQPQRQADWVIDRVTLQSRQAAGDSVLVDARSPERYRGEQEPIDPIAGAIPGAINFFWQWNLNDAGYFHDTAHLAQQWNAMDLGHEPIFYCGSGVTACVNALAQAVLQRPMPKLYVGGWSEWCRTMSRP